MGASGWLAAVDEDDDALRAPVSERGDAAIERVRERIWLVTFVQYNLGYFDDETCRLEPIDNPFGPKVLPMCSE